MIPKPKKNQQGNVVGDFYPLQREELIALRKAKLINNTAFVHLALRYENPYCDRSISLIPKEFALRWQIPESSVYEAIGKLKSCNAITIKSGKLTIEWVDSQQDNNSDNPEKILESQKKLQNPRKKSESSEKITESQKKLRNPRKKSESSENQPPEPLPDKTSKVPHTIQTNSDISNTTDQDCGVENFDFQEEEQPSGVNVLLEFEEQLKIYQIYLSVFDQESGLLIPNPKVESIYQIIEGMSPEKAESSIRAFLAWLSTAKNVRCKYAAFAASLRNQWEINQ
ncbi:hypothetical protein [Anabaena sp. UHCC 0451]|uniref:hypothetical protein n=1 Tax=Anabaena sp. UHCC 0451 TaxID=2055235 RepID=UPI002B2093FA|nr:hypothetical protein [Anabaena sp. UHCC 0451]MEA5578649.1 hypothetical protein [Anabaena sp. UHCC 0451]